MLRIIYTLLIFNGVYFCKSDDDCEARIDTGQISGVMNVVEKNKYYCSFLGVPYAKPPLGKLRFKELEAAESWEDVYSATKESPDCPQNDNIFGSLLLNEREQSEDCIGANIHVPSESLSNQDSSTPIVVMIHGGNLEAGSGTTDLYGPEYLIPKNVIVITFNYRLNVFGFLSLKTKAVPGNQGLRDQITLLRWVQRNAKAFGGDPDNVTLMGQGAGATCAHILSLSKVTTGLFKRLILSSGTALPILYSANAAYAARVAKAFISHTNIKNKNNPTAVHKALTEMKIEKIMEAYKKLQQRFKYSKFIFAPVIEGKYQGIVKILEEGPIQLIGMGRGRDYPTIIGFTSQEYEFYRNSSRDDNVIEHVEEKPEFLLLSRMSNNLPEGKAEQLGKKFHQLCFKNERATLDTYLECQTTLQYKYPAFRMGIWRALTGAPTFLYEFNYESPFSVMKYALQTDYSGASDLEDTTYIFKATSILGNNASRKLPQDCADLGMKDWMTKLFTNFMKCSKPTCGEDDSKWKPVSEGSITYQEIKEPEYRTKEMSEEQQEIVKFVAEVSPVIKTTTAKLEKLRSQSTTPSPVDNVVGLVDGLL